MKINCKKASLAGILGTVAITFVATTVAPLMGLPKMNIPGMLASVMGGSIVLGWLAHFTIGTLLAVGYALIRARFTKGPAVVCGCLYSILPWFVAQVAVMPLMGMGLFSGALAPALGSLIGHLVYGAVVGITYATPIPCRSCTG